jgi:hypothetical protein
MKILPGTRPFLLAAACLPLLLSGCKSSQLAPKVAETLTKGGKVISIFGAKVIVLADQATNFASAEYEDGGYKQVIVKTGGKTTCTTALHTGRYKSIVDVDGDGIPDKAVLRANGKTVKLKVEETP